jgi:group I intron endonuclease
MGYIYLITNMINKKQYVGQTKRPDIQDRWRQHRQCNDATVGRYLCAAYQKHGIQNFKYQIICICFDKDCDSYEEEYIKKYNTLAPNGYNLKSGGHFSKHHPDTKLKISESIKHTWTDEKKQYFSANFSGENAPNYGKKVSNEQKEKLRASLKKYWENISKEDYKRICKERKRSLKNKTNSSSQKALDALAEGRKLNLEHNKKCIGKYDNDGKLLETFPSIAEASTKTGICRSTISKVCLKKGHYKTGGGFVWKYM